MELRIKHRTLEPLPHSEGGSRCDQQAVPLLKVPALCWWDFSLKGVNFLGFAGLNTHPTMSTCEIWCKSKTEFEPSLIQWRHRP